MNAATILIIAFIMVFLGIAYKIPLIGSYVRQIASAVGGHKKAVLILGVVTVLFAFGGMDYLKGMGWPSFSGAVTTTGTQGTGMITDLTGSSGDAEGGCTFSVDGTRPDVSTLRCTDDGTNQTSHSNMTITALKSGAAPMVCSVEVQSANFRSPSDTTDSNEYNVLRKDATGKFYSYIGDGLTKSTVSTDDPQQKGIISFTEGDGSATIGVMLQLDEASTDELNLYDTKNIYIVFDCEGQKKNYIIEYMELDAAA